MCLHKTLIFPSQQLVTVASVIKVKVNVPTRFHKLTLNTAKVTTPTKCHCDPDLWPYEYKINKGHLLARANNTSKFHKPLLLPFQTRLWKYCKQYKSPLLFKTPLNICQRHCEVYLWNCYFSDLYLLNDNIYHCVKVTSGSKYIKLLLANLGVVIGIHNLLIASYPYFNFMKKNPIPVYIVQYVIIKLWLTVIIMFKNSHKTFDSYKKGIRIYYDILFKLSMDPNKYI